MYTHHMSYHDDDHDKDPGIHKGNKEDGTPANTVFFPSPTTGDNERYPEIQASYAKTEGGVEAKRENSLLPL